MKIISVLTDLKISIFSNVAYFHGPWFVRPSEMPTEVLANRTVHGQEAFLSSISDTNPLLAVIGKCFVQELDEYQKCRPTEIVDFDVFFADFLYDEGRKVILKEKNGVVKQYELSELVRPDEIYYFKKPIVFERVSFHYSNYFKSLFKLNCFYRMEIERNLNSLMITSLIQIWDKIR